MSWMDGIHGKQMMRDMVAWFKSFAGFLTLVPCPWFDFQSFGYVIEGADFLGDLKEGDVIVSAKVTKGLEYLVQPKET